MTADEWKPLCPDDLQYEDLQVAVSVRQSLLLCCACCRLGVEDSTGSAGVLAETIDFVEAQADGGRLTHEQWKAWSKKIRRLKWRPWDPNRHVIRQVVHLLNAAAGKESGIYYLWPLMPSAGQSAKVQQVVRTHNLLSHDVKGNVFRAVGFDAKWRNSDVIGLARAIYDDKAFEQMPILADALMDAGCADEKILGHCRGPGPHVRGCWVVDLALGKE